MHLHESPRTRAADHGPVMDVLTTFLREHSWEKGPASTGKARLRADLQAAATVVTRANADGLDLTGVRLPEVSLCDANLQFAILMNADLSRADLAGAKLGGADLEEFLSSKLI
jgi:uncharacterized protein YjbI with pentapeptide repeats